jgi:hypothetical protein
MLKQYMRVHSPQSLCWFLIGQEKTLAAYFAFTSSGVQHDIAIDEKI